MTGQLIQLSRHSYIYRGFTIHKCPRNAITMKTAYSVLNNGNYLGRDFALAEAMRTIDKLKNGGRNET
ncbi:MULTISPECIES: DUF4761 family protein [Citrobacter freundii complex]|uniref:DUF4761 family protein n=1 Tax=Citrobacter freundii complex TaxID=1344959 RepID=UPI000CDCD112|nr:MULTISPECIES: DUF4761 family protein [Citrobacter freundii complex]AUZ72016.1 DUF4761 domain-containing protein [Citrobacter freundii complex sp. CFNIH4]MCT4726287.1 DUF4761 family protein [Citrobacter freundii]MCT4747408.1 DUF4761 family protein [Citrobacter freundii]MDT7167009.1 DUF4761 family protein [Citrobacter freundii]MDT7207254.1 DUF4761 family protein [Citrobacter freundii]